MLSTGLPTTALEESWRARRAHGTAAVLAIGTANPATFVRQDEFADWYFRVTKSQHLAVLKAKTKRICDKSGIAKRNIDYIEEMIDRDPQILNRDLPSLGKRLGIAADAVPELAAAAAARAIAEWRRPAADITDLVFTTSSGAQTPGADLRLATLLGLNPAVRRTMLYLHGCSAGCGAFRVAKDLAENNRGARVLVVCAEVSLLAFRAPYEARIVELLAATLFGDGAGAAVVGAGPMDPVERPIFHMVSASQVTLPGTEHAVDLHLTESGVNYCISSELPALAGSNIERCLAEVLAPFGLAGGSDCWNSLFWAAHPGGRAILDSYEAALGLEPGKLAASRHILSENGNMLGATIFFVLDEIRRRRKGGDVRSEWGVMLGIGPGITIETMLLHATDKPDQV